MGVSRRPGISGCGCDRNDGGSSNGISGCDGSGNGNGNRNGISGCDGSGNCSGNGNRSGGRWCSPLLKRRAVIDAGAALEAGYVSCPHPFGAPSAPPLGATQAGRGVTS